jgi:hypothetical protein
VNDYMNVLNTHGKPSMPAFYGKTNIHKLVVCISIATVPRIGCKSDFGTAWMKDKAIMKSYTCTYIRTSYFGNLIMREL